VCVCVCVCVRVRVRVRVHVRLVIVSHIPDATLYVSSMTLVQFAVIHCGRPMVIRAVPVELQFGVAR